MRLALQIGLALALQLALYALRDRLLPTAEWGAPFAVGESRFSLLHRDWTFNVAAFAVDILLTLTAVRLLTRRTGARGVVAAGAALVLFLALLVGEAALIARGIDPPIIGLPFPALPGFPQSLTLWIDGLVWIWAGARLSRRDPRGAR